MKSTTLFLLAACVLSAEAFGGWIDVTLFENGKPLADRKIQITCGTEVLAPVTRDSWGVWRFFTRHEGTCEFQLLDPVPLSHKIYSYRDPVRYDFDLIRQDGGYLLRRR